MGIFVLDERSSAFISGFPLKYKNLRMLRKLLPLVAQSTKNKGFSESSVISEAIIFFLNATLQSPVYKKGQSLT